jgi:hypothetical protein
MLFWIESQSTSVIALIAFGGAYLLATIIFCVAAFLSRLRIAKELELVTPGILSPLGAILGILFAFLALRVWTNLDHAEEYVGHEISALREISMLANSLPPDIKARVREAIGRHLEVVVSEEWPAMAEGRVSLRAYPPHLEEAMNAVLSFAPVGTNQELAQNRALVAIEDAVEFRRYRVGLSRAEIAPIQWTVIAVLSGMILITIAVIHINRKLAMAIALFVFSTAVAVCFVLLLVYDRPFGSGGFTLLPTAYGEAMPN